MTSAYENNKTGYWYDLGLIDYSAAMIIQGQIVNDRINSHIPDTLLLLEHPHIYTIGKTLKADQHLLCDKTELKKMGIDVTYTDRGGDITYHGPGQLVGYLIFDLKQHGNDIYIFVSLIEELIIELLRACSVKAERSNTNPGVWSRNNKICALGLAVRKGITYHGFALNISTDLSKYQNIIACGIKYSGVTSLEALLKESQFRLEEIKLIIPDLFKKHFSIDLMKMPTDPMK